MRVLAVGNRYPPATAGGYERIFAASVAALGAAGHEVRVLTPPELEWYWHDGAFPALGLRERARLETRNAAVLRGVLDAFRPDVVSWWGMGGMSLSLIEQVRRAEVPAVGVVGDGWMVYGPDADQWTRGWRRHRLAARVAARITGAPTRLDLGAGVHWLFISEAVRARALREGHALPSTELAHPGVDPALFAARPAAPWAWRLACVGRVEARKGIAVAIRALAELPEATLTVDGPVEGGHGDELEALAASLGVAGRVRFACSDPERVAEVYAAADAVLFPVTWAEPWGLVPLEAMSVGRPVVASGTGGSAEYLADGVNALIAPPGDVQALVATVGRLAADERLRQELIKGGQLTAARFSSGAFEAAVVSALEDTARS